MNPNTDHDERVRQIRERRHAATLPANQRGLLHTASWVDIDYLLSLLDSQAAGGALHQQDVYDAALAELCDPDLFNEPEKANELAWAIAERTTGTKTTVIDGERRLVIPCPDNRIGCEVLHTAPLARAPVTKTNRGRCIHNVPICGDCEIREVLAHVMDKEKISDDAATRMRDLCVERVREYLTDCRDEERGIIEAIASELRSLTLEEKNYAADGFSGADR